MNDRQHSSQHRATDQDPETPYDHDAAGGWGSLKGLARIFGESASSTEAFRILSNQNKFT